MKKVMLLMVTLIISISSAGCDATNTIKPTSISTPTANIERQGTPGQLIWSDEFNGVSGTSPDPSKWTPQTGGKGWGNKQLEYDTDNHNAYQDGQGNLVLEARKNSKGLQCWYGTCKYKSARITTKGNFSFTYGRIEARIKVPSGKGFWPAFWLLGDNISSVGWPACGEIDIMEIKGKEPSINYGAAHSPVGLLKKYELQDGSFADNFDTFALEWAPDQLSYFVDGNNYVNLEKASLTDQQKWVFDHPFNIILNLAVGGLFPENPDDTTVFPQKMQVDYVRVYR